VSNCAQRLLKTPIHSFLKSEFKEFGIFLIAIAILINSKKTDAMLLALASTALIALLTGARIVRIWSTSCQNWRFRRRFFTVSALRKISD
jgi:hypothetical protein